MVVTIRLDAKCAALWIAYLGIAVGAIWFAFPGVRAFAPADSSSLAGWVQAAGSLLAIAATWYITTAQQRAENDKELRLAALDASTMLEEVISARSSFADVQGSLGMMLCFPDKVFAPAILGLSSKVLSINFRPLRDHDRLAHVGSTYLGKAAEILQQISNLKTDVEQARFMFEYVREDAFDKYAKILDDIELAQRNCTDAARLLQAFAASQGIKLTIPE